MDGGKEGYSAQVEKPRVPTFVSEDPLLQSVRTRLLANSERRTTIKQLLSKDFRSSEPEIVGIRSEDVLTFLDSLLEGHASVQRADQVGIMAKTEGWFYMTPTYSNSYYNEHPELRGDTTYDSFTETIIKNSELYADNAAFGAAFARNVIPVLRKGWLQEARRVVNQVEGSTEDYSDPLVIEKLIDIFQKSINSIKEIGVSAEQALSPTYKRRLAMIQELVTLIRPQVDKVRITKFLLDVVEKRGGVLVGFNKNIFQGKVVSDAMGLTEIIHGSPEIATKPSTEKVDLSQSIAAVEPLGKYEDEILSKLGITS